jgi:uncharacterized membrane protein YeaQ/YmgE (transglycosylase-associated protein family)
VILNPAPVQRIHLPNAPTRRSILPLSMFGRKIKPEQHRKNGGTMGLITWIIVGLIAGWLAGQVMKGGGYGVLVDIILGILGGIVGGWVFGALGLWPGGGIIASIIVAFVGAVILVGITRLIKRA